MRPEILNRVRREYKQHDQKAFPGQGNPVEEELVKLRRKLAEVKMEGDILKKQYPFSARNRNEI